MGLIFVLSGCSMGVVEGTLQTSKSIEESKKDNFFISEYVVEQKPKGIFKINRAWEEKSWGYKVLSIFSSEKVILLPESTELLFNIDTSSAAKYAYANFSDWQLDDVKRARSVGYHGGVYRLSLQDYPSPDTIKLTLMSGPIGKRKEVGELTFIRQH